jgi:hypothetical protein
MSFFNLNIAPMYGVIVLKLDPYILIVEVIGWCGVYWIGLAQDRFRWRSVVKAVMNLMTSRVVLGAIESVTSPEVM